MVRVSRNKKLVLLAVAGIAIAASIPVSVLLLGGGTLTDTDPDPTPGPYDSFILAFTGDMLVGDVNVTYAALNGSVHARHQASIFTRNSYGVDDTFTVVGVRLADLIVDLGIDYGTATGIQFIATDGFESPFVPLSMVFGHPDQVLIYNVRDGDYLTNETEGGSGPLRAVVNWTALGPIANDPFHAKWLSGVSFVECLNVNLTIHGAGILDSNVTIPLGMLQTARNFFVPSVTGNYTLNVSGTVETSLYKGAALWGLINRTAGLIHLPSYGDWTHLRFVNATTASPWIPKLTISGSTTNRNQYLVAWESDGAGLGSMTGIVNSTIHNPNAAYWITKLTGIEIGAP